MTSPKGSILVTGANGGLGCSIVSHILNESKLSSYYGLYTVRAPERATAVQSVLQKCKKVSHDYELVSLELTSLASTRKAAEAINAKVAAGEIPLIRALILNAGWQEYFTQTNTEDGFDTAFQSNFLSHFLFTLLLLKSMDKEHGRVVVLGSWSHDTADPRNNVPGLLNPFVTEKYSQVFKEPLDIEPLARGKWSPPDEEPDPSNPGYKSNPGYRRYGASKLCEVMFMRELSKRISTDPALSSIAVLAVDPGGMSTGLTRRGNSVLNTVGKVLSPFMGVLVKIMPGNDFRTTAQSASDVIAAAFDTEKLGVKPNGFYMDGHVKSEPGAEAKDDVKCERLWVDSLGYAQVKAGDTCLVNWQ
ncbi:NAD(P)-binding protein [Xylariaceae sp. FL1019]|nr:NAD(P)-binding protein [Xylariaceae sp. FL1019]